MFDKYFPLVPWIIRIWWFSFYSDHRRPIRFIASPIVKHIFSEVYQWPLSFRIRKELQKRILSLHIYQFQIAVDLCLQTRSEYGVLLLQHIIGPPLQLITDRIILPFTDLLKDPLGIIHTDLEHEPLLQTILELDPILIRAIFDRCMQTFD